MSWTVAEVGKAKAVAPKIAQQFLVNPCQEPEETIRQAAARTIATVLEGQDPSNVVKVIASGSMGFKDYAAKTGPYNSVSIAVEVLHGFLE
jgi:hypothetical protein